MSTWIQALQGWTYGLNGVLCKATRISGIQDCIRNGPFLLLNMEKESLRKDDIGTNSFANEWLGSCLEILSLNGVDSPLAYVYRREYIIKCNWKVCLSC
ncbi:hypothetical protein SCA6_011135 [Theobroma cacao]